MKTYVLFLASALILDSNLAWAHGEDKPGPNGGFIRMPGAYHTELVPQGKNSLKVFLLNLQWKDPTLKNSKIEINYQGKTSAAAKCSTSKNYFICTFPTSVDLTAKGQLKVLSEREGQKGIEVTYPLPFTLEAAAATPTDHSGHH